MSSRQSATEIELCIRLQLWRTCVRVFDLRMTMLMCCTLHFCLSICLYCGFGRLAKFGGNFAVQSGTIPDLILSLQSILQMDLSTNMQGEIKAQHTY